MVVVGLLKYPSVSPVTVKVVTLCKVPLVKCCIVSWLTLAARRFDGSPPHVASAGSLGQARDAPLSGESLIGVF